MNQVEQFEQARPLMFSIAYRMLGTAMEAEDMVQEAFLRWQATDAVRVDSPQAFLATIVTRLCIDHLRSAHVRREQYIGPWLPEPLVSDPAAGPAEATALADSLSMAFLVILERLGPEERAAFLLREIFDYEYAEIAEILDKSEANCRQMVSRARRRVARRRPRFDTTPAQQAQVVQQFLATAASGNVEGLLALLDKDVTWWSDGNGRTGIARKPIRGARNVARFVLNLARMAETGAVTRMAAVNGEAGYVIYVDGQPFAVMAFEFARGKIIGVRAVANPEKLTRIPPLT